MDLVNQRDTVIRAAKTQQGKPLEHLEIKNNICNKIEGSVENPLYYKLMAVNYVEQKQSLAKI